MKPRILIVSEKHAAVKLELSVAEEKISLSNRTTNVHKIRKNEVCLCYHTGNVNWTYFNISWILQELKEPLGKLALVADINTLEAIQLIRAVIEWIIDQFRYIKIQPKTIDFNTRLLGINPTNSVVIPMSLVLRSIVLGWILIYRNWSIWCNLCAVWLLFLKCIRDDFSNASHHSAIKTVESYSKLYFAHCGALKRI